MQIDLKLQQKQTLSHSQIQALHVLAFDAMELDQFLHDEYLENHQDYFDEYASLH